MDFQNDLVNIQVWPHVHLIDDYEYRWILHWSIPITIIRLLGIVDVGCIWVYIKDSCSIVTDGVVSYGSYCINIIYKQKYAPKMQNLIMYRKKPTTYVREHYILGNRIVLCMHPIRGISALNRAANFPRSMTVHLDQNERKGKNSYLASCNCF